jgi:formate/nitrite transporter FocA (FNT family)
LIDTSFRYSGLHFELHQTEIAQCCVPPLGMIEALDEIEQVGFSVALAAGTSAPLSVTDAVGNLVLVTLGNILGGTVLVAWVDGRCI